MTTGIVPIGDEPRQARRRVLLRARAREAQRATMRDEVLPEVDQHRQQRPEVAGHIEREAEPVGIPAEECLRENQVGGARHRQELGESLDDAEQHGFEQNHKVLRADGGGAHDRPALAAGRSR